MSRLSTWTSGRGRLRLLVIAAAGSVIAGSGAAYAAVTLHGQTELVSPPIARAGLSVSAARLEPALTPGDSSALVFTVRNLSRLTVIADRVTLKVPLHDAKPAGCTSKVSGPLLSRRGLALTGGDRVVLGPGQTADITVPDALRLARSATHGCGFRVTLDVQAVQGKATPTTSPTGPIKGQPGTGSTTLPTSPTGPIKGQPGTGSTTPPTTETITPPPPMTDAPTTSPTVMSPPPTATTDYTPPPTFPGDGDCDPASGDCSAGS